MRNRPRPTDPKNIHEQLFGLAAEHAGTLLAIAHRVDEIQDQAEVHVMPPEAEALTKAVHGFLKQYAPAELADDPG